MFLRQPAMRFIMSVCLGSISRNSYRVLRVFRKIVLFCNTAQRTVARRELKPTKHVPLQRPKQPLVPPAAFVIMGSIPTFAASVTNGHCRTKTLVIICGTKTVVYASFRCATTNQLLSSDKKPRQNQCGFGRFLSLPVRRCSKVSCAGHSRPSLSAGSMATIGEY